MRPIPKKKSVRFKSSSENSSIAAASKSPRTARVIVRKLRKISENLCRVRVRVRVRVMVRVRVTDRQKDRPRHDGSQQYIKRKSVSEKGYADDS